MWQSIVGSQVIFPTEAPRIERDYDQRIERQSEYKEQQGQEQHADRPAKRTEQNLPRRRGIESVQMGRFDKGQ